MKDEYFIEIEGMRLSLDYKPAKEIKDEVAKRADKYAMLSSEIKAIRECCGPDFLIVTPGIRPKWAAVNDQKRIKTPSEAIADGANYIVVGRPITEAGDPADAMQKILSEIENG